MTVQSSSTSTRWQDIVVRYQRPTLAKSGWQMANTLIPFVACWALAYRLLDVSRLASFGACILATGFLVRIYILQHDCGHASFFKSVRANDVLGSVLGVFTLMPYFRWRHDHALHHATSGNLAKRGAGDVWVMTIREYQAATPRERLMYRAYRNAIVLFVLAPFALFVVWQRFTDWTVSRKEVWSVYGTNLALVVLVALGGTALGWGKFLAVQLPITWMGSTIAVWLFYMQHQFETTYWSPGEEWDYFTSATRGASWYKLPKVLQWFTGNIGIHHIHHLSPKIPNYELQRCMDENALFQNPGVVPFLAGFHCAFRKIWDEESRRLVTWGEADKIMARAPVEARSAA